MRYMMIAMLGVVLLLAGCTKYSEQTSEPKTYYVDAINGDDTMDGLSELTAWQTLEKVSGADISLGSSVLFRRGQSFRGQLWPASGVEGMEVYYGAYSEGDYPKLLGSMKLELNQLELVEEHIYRYSEPIYWDVGNMFINDYGRCGVKKYNLVDIREDFDFYYDEDETLFVYYSGDVNEITWIEAGLSKNVVDYSDCSYVIFENLHVMGGSAHGFGGGDTDHLTIRDCEVSYIGGGLLTYRDGEPISYGNGIEFWSSASNHLVEGNYIHDIFDTGVTNQGIGKDIMHQNISYLNNKIERCGMGSFELWIQDSKSFMENISFIGNDCYGAGMGWSEKQSRHEYNSVGHHVISFGSSAKTDNIVISDNTFDTAVNINDAGSTYLFSWLPEAMVNSWIIENNVSTGSIYESIRVYDDGVFMIEAMD